MNRRIVFALLLLAGAGYFVVTQIQGAQEMLILESKSFSDMAQIPTQYTCHGVNVSPELHWRSDLKNVGSYVVVVDDPDAQRVVGKTFVHWIAYLSGRITHLPEGASGHGASLMQFDAATYEARNDFGKNVYGGPCPPKGSGVHVYRFTLFALKETVDQLITSDKLKAPFTAEMFEKSMEDSILGQARITGKYETK